MLPSLGVPNGRHMARSSPSLMSAVCITTTSLAPLDDWRCRRAVARLPALARSLVVCAYTVTPPCTIVASLGVRVLKSVSAASLTSPTGRSHGADGVSGRDQPTTTRSFRPAIGLLDTTGSATRVYWCRAGRAGCPAPRRREDVAEREQHEASGEFRCGPILRIGLATVPPEGMHGRQNAPDPSFCTLQATQYISFLISLWQVGH